MSAWGHRIFDDDTTLDALNDLNNSQDILEAIEQFLTEAVESSEDYLESDAASYGLAAASAIDAKLNGIDLELLSDGCAEEDLDLVLKKLENCDVSGLRNLAANTVRAVAAENSELRELWEENKELYPEVMSIWKKLIKRLSEE